MNNLLHTLIYLRTGFSLSFDYVDQGVYHLKLFAFLTSPSSEVLHPNECQMSVVINNLLNKQIHWINKDKQIVRWLIFVSDVIIVILEKIWQKSTSSRGKSAALIMITGFECKIRNRNKLIYCKIIPLNWINPNCKLSIAFYHSTLQLHATILCTWDLSSIRRIYRSSSSSTRRIKLGNFTWKP